MTLLGKKIEQYRKENPRSRAQNAFVHVKNTQATKQKKCIFCDEKGPSWCARYPQTRTAKEWEKAHLVQHMQKWECSETHGSATSGRELVAYSSKVG